MGVISEERQLQRAKFFQKGLGGLLIAIPILGDFVVTIGYLWNVKVILLRSSTIALDLLLNTAYVALFYAGLIVPLLLVSDGKMTFMTYIVSAVIRIPVFNRWVSHMAARLPSPKYD